MEAIQNLASWSERFDKWADQLEVGRSSRGSSGGGGNGGGEGEAILKELMTLLRLREREVNVRQRTALVEMRKPTPAAYQQAAASLLDTQQKMRDEVHELQGENPEPALEFPLQAVHDSMQEVESFLSKPQTDQVTEQAEGKTIELLSDVINLINEQAERTSSSKSSSSEEMAFLIQMMSQENSTNPGMNPSPKGGGNTAGGATDRPATPFEGDTRGQGGDARTIQRAGGSTANFPTEFREALENYFRAVEKEK